MKFVKLLPPAYVVRGKVIFILGNVCLFTLEGGVPGPGPGVCVGGVPGLRSREGGYPVSGLGGSQVSGLGGVPGLRSRGVPSLRSGGVPSLMSRQVPSLSKGKNF